MVDDISINILKSLGIKDTNNITKAVITLAPQYYPVIEISSILPEAREITEERYRIIPEKDEEYDRKICSRRMDEENV